MTLEELKARRIDRLTKARAIASRVEGAGRDYTKAEREEIAQYVEEADRLGKEYKSRKAAAQNVDEISRLLTEGDPEFDQDGHSSKGRRSFNRFASSFSSSAAKAFTEASPRAKAVTTQALGSFTAGTPYVAGTTEEVVGPDPALGVLALISGDTVKAGKTFDYLQELSTNTNNAAVVPDKGLKPTSKKELKEITDELKVIAHLSEPLPNRYLDDYAGFKNYLQTVMARDLIRKLNDEVVNGTGGDTHLTGILNTTGVLSQAWSTGLAQTLRKARTLLMNKDEQPTAWLVAPADLETIDLFADTAERFQSLREIMGNLPMVPCTGLATGTAILGDFRLATLMDDGRGTKLDATDSSPYSTGNDVNGNPIISGNLFDHNMFKLRAEMRVGGLAITRPSGFVVVDLSA